MKRLLWITIYLTGLSAATAQITVTNGVSLSVLVNTLLGSGVTASNVSFAGVYGVGGKYQAGQFTTSVGVGSALGINSGILLSTGHTSDVSLSLSTFPGNTSLSSSGLTSTCSNGEIRQGGTCPVYINDVDVLAGPKNYYNAAILEFDFIPNNTFVSFRYVFGSEEYDQNDGSGLPINYNCSSYNDKFGFIISGPGIAGGQGYTNNGRNIARLSNGAEVSINSVNNGSVGTYGGSPAASNCIAANPAWVEGVSTAEFAGPVSGIQFNGNTKVLTASQSGLTVGATYHIKLIVTDVNDGAYDSGVFLQAGSFSSPVVLPVELIAFDAKCNEDYTEVTWSTASEKNNSHFLLQRAGESLLFETIATINGTGNSKETNVYSYKDLNAGDINYYRLVQVDADGTQNKSKIVVSKNTCQSNFLVDKLYYDANEHNLMIHCNAALSQIATVTLYDMIGKEVYTEKSEVVVGQNILRITTSDLSSGLYLCAFSTPEHTILKKIIINK